MKVIGVIRGAGKVTAVRRERGQRQHPDRAAKRN
jgi:hypothetical protein